MQKLKQNIIHLVQLEYAKIQRFHLQIFQGTIRLSGIFPTAVIARLSGAGLALVKNIHFPALMMYAQNI